MKRFATLIAGALLLAGCGPSGQTGGAGAVASTPNGPSRTPPATAGGQGRNVTASDKDNGKTMTVASGGTVTIKLNSTYWKFAADTSSPALREVGQPKTVAKPMNAGHCVPGEGCGTVTAMFAAASPGKAVITASRTTCGEARGCTGGQGSYQLTVVVQSA